MGRKLDVMGDAFCKLKRALVLMMTAIKDLECETEKRAKLKAGLILIRGGRDEPSGDSLHDFVAGNSKLNVIKLEDEVD